ncbi:MAG: 2,3-bisphosphoglycerate-independent phosphoglycerate mutase [Patescibacteria group bacterium]
MRKTVVLAILDGWGIGTPDESNPIYTAKPKAIDFIERRYPAGALQSSGMAVGLPWEEVGNSEVGHLTIGAGRVLFQHFPKISMAIDEGTFFKNLALREAFIHAKRTGGAVHLVGLLSSGNVHASFSHLLALLDLAKSEECSALFLHLFLDGRDSSPRSAGEIMHQLHAAIAERGIGIVATLSGRYYGMDRDQHWDRTERAYRLIAEGRGQVTSPAALLEATYRQGLSDEYAEPSVIEAPYPVRDGDAIIFFNFREDRMRQLVEAFANPSFARFEARRFQNLSLVTMTEYQMDFPVRVAFETEIAERPLGRVLAEAGKTQLRITETEKYAHVTYFFNGLREEPFENEFRVLIPSRRLIHHDEQPEMMARELTDRVIAALSEGAFDFILVNYANPDVVAHTGNYDATIAAIRTVDREIGRLAEQTLGGGHVLFITSDHGNAEVVLELKTGRTETQHDPNPVPFYLVAQEFERRTPLDGFVRLPTIGLLSDIAPTILELMGIEKPPEMTGESLLSQLAQRR